MKRELAFALESQFQIGGSLGRTRTSTAWNGVFDDHTKKKSRGSGTDASEMTAVAGDSDKTRKKKTRVSCLTASPASRRSPRFTQANSASDSEGNEDENGCNSATPIPEEVGMADAREKAEGNEDENGCNSATPIPEEVGMANAREKAEGNEDENGCNSATPIPEEVGMANAREKAEGNEDENGCNSATPIPEEVGTADAREKGNVNEECASEVVAVKVPRRFTRSLLNSEKNNSGSAVSGSKASLVVSMALDESSTDAIVKVPRRFTRSALASRTGVVSAVDSRLSTVVVPMPDEESVTVAVKAPRRFTRSAVTLKSQGDPSAHSNVQPSVSKVSGIVQNNLDLMVVPNEDTLGNNLDLMVVPNEDTLGTLETPTKKLELKMSKKIASAMRPTTLKELFASGLLEGLDVFYYCRTSKRSTLRGLIKGNGILCFCSACKGIRVVAPSKFELHACKSYRRALKFIQLENGKSLLEVLMACKNSPLDMLGETIQSVIGPFAEKESVICQNCNGSFLAKCAENAEQLCQSCVNLKDLGATKNHEAVTSPGSVELLLASRKSTRHSEEATPSQDRSHGRKTKDRASKGALFKRVTRSGVALASPLKKKQGKITKRLSKSVSPRKLNRSAANQSKQKTATKSPKAVSARSSTTLTSPSASAQDKSKWKITKKDLSYHKLIFKEGGLPDGTEVAYYVRGQKLLEGYKRGMGIFCRCCNSEVSASQFEAHAGFAVRRKPYHNIYTSNGVSLHEFAVSMLKNLKRSGEDNDDLCTICADGGQLLLCDGCPRAFHIECTSLPSIPRGKWYCNYCQNMFQRERFAEHNANALAAGRVSGVDPIKQITNRCIRIVKSTEDGESIACVLCRGYDFSKSGFGPRTVIVCDQCEKEYHVECLKKHKLADLKELPKEKWFCCMDCTRIDNSLRNLLMLGEEKITGAPLDVIMKKKGAEVTASPTEFNVTWRVLSGKTPSRETRVLLSKAVAIFHECFAPIVDSVTGRDFIPSMVYGRSIRDQEFGGMYCAVLMVNSQVVSAGIFRIFGQEIAELPLVATSADHQGKGYFQLLFSCIENFFASLKVKSLVLPAAAEAEAIWTKRFGFEKISPVQLSDYRRTCAQMVTFKGTCMLEKAVPGEVNCTGKSS